MNNSIQPREIGVPVKSVSHVKLFAGSRADGRPELYATFGQTGAPFFVVGIDLETGHCTKYASGLARADAPVSAWWSARHGCLYVGSCYTGHLHRLDPKVGRMEDLGPIHAAVPGAAIFPCSMDEHPDGSLYIGSYGHCDLTRFDPATGRFTNFGRMDPVDMYLYVMCGTDGTVAGLVRVSRPHVVAFDPRTGEHRTVGPVADTQTQQGSVGLFKGRDGLLYVKSHNGDFRIQGLEAVPVNAVPEPAPPPALADGSTFRFLDADVGQHRTLEIASPTGQKRVLHLDWEGDGTALFFCHLGPDGKIYGSSILPEHLFSYDLATGRCLDHGACSTALGEAFSMGNLDGRLYIASYPEALVSVYDPARPYHFGSQPGDNPRELGRIDEVAYRPRAMVAGPAGKVWFGSIPNYGMWGGTLASYDPGTGRFVSHRHVIPDCSPMAMTWLAKEKQLLVGFGIEGGTGTQPRAERAGLVLWDPVADAPVWRDDFGLNIQSVQDLCAVGNGLVYALILLNGKDERPALHLLDVSARKSVARHVLTAPPHGDTFWGEPSLFPHRGFVYGATYRGVYRAPIGTVDVEMYWTAPEGGDPGGLGAVLADTWYYPANHRLMALPLPRERDTEGT